MDDDRGRIEAPDGVAIMRAGSLAILIKNTAITAYASISPSAATTATLGKSGQEFSDLYFDGFYQSVQITTPANPSVNSGRFYTKDVSGTAEWFAMDEAGSETQISPHNITAPNWFYDRKGIDEVHITYQHILGLVTYTNVTRAARLASMLDSEKALLSGAKRQTVLEETFQEHNTRMGTILVTRDWAAIQVKNQADYDKHRIEMQAELDEWTTKTVKQRGGVDAPVIPPVADIRKPKPSWLVAA